MTTLAAARLAGIDGCPAGWIACLVAPDGPLLPEIRVVARLTDLFEGPHAPAIAAIDMPIGLPETIGPEGRGPERLVRPMLGKRQSSVFSIPSRAAVYAGEDEGDGDAYRRACAVALATSDPPKKISRQAFGLFPKIRELDRLLADLGPDRLVESHPEVAFAVLNGAAMKERKKEENRPNPAGLDERRAFLETHGFEAAFLARPPRGAGPDDLLDACVLALVARRVMRGEAISHPTPPGRDGRGLPVRIVA